MSTISIHVNEDSGSSSGVKILKEQCHESWKHFKNRLPIFSISCKTYYILFLVIHQNGSTYRGKQRRLY